MVRCRGYRGRLDQRRDGRPVSELTGIGDEGDHGSFTPWSSLVNGSLSVAHLWRG